MAPTHYSPFEYAFVAQELRCAWERVSDRRGSGKLGTARAVRLSLVERARHVPAGHPEPVVWDSYEEAETSLNAVLLHEAACQFNNAVEGVSFGNPNFPAYKEQTVPDVRSAGVLKLVSSVSTVEDYTVFKLELFDAKGIPAKKGNARIRRPQVSMPWRTGELLVLALSEGDFCLAAKEELDEGGSIPADTVASESSNEPVLRPGLVARGGRILFAVKTGWSLTNALLEWQEARASGGIDVYRIRKANSVSGNFPTLLSLVRHSRALAEVASSPHAQYVANPRNAWQSTHSADYNVMQKVYEVERDKLPSENVSQVPPLTEEQSIVPLVLGGRVARRANTRWYSGGSRSKSSNFEAPVFFAVQGPPGSGKSTTIVTVVADSLSKASRYIKFSTGKSCDYATGSVLRSHPRFLITAPTNFATDELLYRFVRDDKIARLVANLRTVEQGRFSRAVDAFLECCTFVRIGMRSQDTRTEVADCVDDRVVERCVQVIRKCLDSVREDCAKLDRQKTGLQGQLDHLMGLIRRVEDYKGGTNSTILIDGTLCSLQGIEPGIEYMKKLANRLGREVDFIDRERIELSCEQARMQSVFCQNTENAETTTVHDRQYLERLIFCNAVCIFSTCDGAAALSEAYRPTSRRSSDRSGRAAVSDAAGFDLVVVDEAARCTMPQLLVPVAVAHNLDGEKSEQRVFDVCAVGDPAQSSATVLSTCETYRQLLSTSFLERALVLMHEEREAQEKTHQSILWPPSYILVLKKQFRMHPMISEFPREAFYGGELQDGLDPFHFARPWHFKWGRSGFEHGIGPLLFVATDLSSTSGGICLAPTRIFQDALFVKKQYPGSKGNLGEALVLVKILVVLRRLVDRSCRGDGKPERKPSVLVLAPYTLQRDLVADILKIDPVPKSEPARGRRGSSAMGGWQWLFRNDSSSGKSFATVTNLLKLVATQFENCPVQIGDGSRSQEKQTLQFLTEIAHEIPKLRDCFDITVSTIDASIGREVDIVLQTKVAGDTDFLKDRKRMCVGLTRASSLLVVCGQAGSRDDGDVDYSKRFASYCNDKGCLMSVEECLDYLDRVCKDD